MIDVRRCLSFVTARLDRAICSNTMALIDGLVEPGHDEKDECRSLGTLV